ncbi:hypothetical protein DH2020_025906 [Rehmannia glutinosa]|uniref:phosphatidate phosphatase n=1 Tax=Rehmannia glutinosa TaxID=99300 RepID=A0ABR0VYC6_REHGL
MNVVGKVGSLITQGMYSVATPFHPFGGAVDIIVVKQHDGTFRSTPWYVRFGKFQGVLKGAEKIVKIEVNGIEANFHMYLDNSGEAYFVREVDPGKDDNEVLTDSDNLQGAGEDNDLYGQTGGDFINGEVEVPDEPFDLDIDRLGRVESDSGHIFYEFQDEQSSLEGSVEFPEYGSSRHNTLDSVEHSLESHNSNSEVVLVSVDGHILTAPILSFERNSENMQVSTPQFHLAPTLPFENCLEHSEVDGENQFHAQESHDSNNKDKELCVDISPESTSTSLKRDEVFQSCLELSELAIEDPHKKSPRSALRNYETEKRNNEILRVEAASNEHVEPRMVAPIEDMRSDISAMLEISLCGNLLHAGMGLRAAENAFNANLISAEEFKLSAASIVKNENLIIRLQGKYLPWGKAAHIILGTAAFDLNLPVNPHDVIPVDDSGMTSTPSRRWSLWPIPFRRVKTLEHTVSISSNDDIFVDFESLSESQLVVATPTAHSDAESPRKQIIRTNIPTTDQITSLNLKEGMNIVKFVFSTRVLGSQKVEAHIYLWKWNTRIVISDVDGTITKSDVLGQFMPLVGKDWTHSGIARLFSAIKENGYQLLFLSARAIVQAYLTKSFLFNLKQDGKSLPSGPVVISPDGLFPSLYREGEDIKALFPPDYNPFYAGFGNRDTDELSYRRIGIPKGKIFIINPKGEVAINHRVDVKSYTSLHTLVNDMFPPTSLVEQGARNFQNYKLAVKRLEEVSVSCRGIERVQLLRRWLVALKEIERLNEAANSEHLDKSSELNDPPAKPNVVMYYDPDLGGEPMNFRDIFLRSQALEGITLSLILEEPSEEELSLLLEIFRLCLMGEKEVHDVTVNSVRDLAKAFTTYNEEVLAKREELLQYAQDAIAGLKVNAEIVRIDSEVSKIHTKLDDMKNQLPFSDGNLKEALEHIKLCSRLEELLLQKKLIKNGDSPTAHNQKVDKLKILSESLASSSLKAEKRISDNRMQKEEALKFRVTKTSEMGQLEKELTAEIRTLQKRKDELEDELKKVTTALTSAHGRLHNAREERDQFDEASNQIIQHFKSKDDELSKSIASYRAEAEVCNTFVNFLESTWVFQSSYANQTEKLVNSARLDGIPTTDEKNDADNSRKTLEEQYKILETKLITTFSVVDCIKKQFSTQEDEDSRKSDAKVNELLDALEKIKSEFESIERPKLEFEAPTMIEDTPTKPRTPRLPFLSPKEKNELNSESTSENEAQRGMPLSFSPIITLPLLKLELELESHSRRSSIDGIIDWEFDEKIEKEPPKSAR